MLDIQLQRTVLDVAAAAAAVVTPDAGGIAIFLGTTRAQSPPTGTDAGATAAAELVALEYHAYDEMAVAEIRKIAGEAQNRWPVKKMVVWHRLGVVKIGEASVVIAVSCPHRGEAFAACEFVIDSLKKTVPIWKREVYRDGQRWQLPA